MKTFVYLDPEADHPFVNGVRDALERSLGSAVPGKAFYKTQWWSDTLDGYGMEFGYMLTEMPAALRSVPIIKVVITDTISDVVGLTDGLYDDTPGIRCQVDSYTHIVDGPRYFPIRVESVGLTGVDAVTRVNDFFTDLRQHPKGPTTPWVPVAPSG